MANAFVSGPEIRTFPNGRYAFRTEDLSIYYGSFRAVKQVIFDIPPRQITALIEPSGCGKSTVLRCLNRMNDLIAGSYITGKVLFGDGDLYDPAVDPVRIRRQIGMVFQRPNPFPKSIYDNVAFGPRLNGFRGSRDQLDDLVEESLRSAALWDEVKDKL